MRFISCIEGSRKRRIATWCMQLTPSKILKGCIEGSRKRRIATLYTRNTLDTLVCRLHWRIQKKKDCYTQFFLFTSLRIEAKLHWRIQKKKDCYEIASPNHSASYSEVALKDPEKEGLLLSNFTVFREMSINVALKDPEKEGLLHCHTHICRDLCLALHWRIQKKKDCYQT